MGSKAERFAELMTRRAAERGFDPERTSRLSARLSPASEPAAEPAPEQLPAAEEVEEEAAE
jgi:hypothetical protein